jgi:hypothetical protein
MTTLNDGQLWATGNARNTGQSMTNEDGQFYFLQRDSFPNMEPALALELL